MKILRSWRGYIATALTAGALLALPGAALAAAELEVTVKEKSGASYLPAGNTATYLVTVKNTGDAPVANGETGTIQLKSNYDSYGLSNGVTTNDGTAGSDAFTVTQYSTGLDIEENFDGVMTAEFDVSVPSYEKTSSFYVTLSGIGFTGITTNLPVTSSSLPNFKGNGLASKLSVSYGPTISAPAGVANEWAPRGASIHSTATITNHGAGSAYDLNLRTNVLSNTSPLTPRVPVLVNGVWEFDYSPSSTIGGANCAAGSTTEMCLIPEIAPGASVTVDLAATGFTHLGATADLYLSGLNRDGFYGIPEISRQSMVSGYVDGVYHSFKDSGSVKITDGGIVRPQVKVTGPEVAASNTDVSYKVEVSNGSRGAITNGLLRISVTAFDKFGAQTSGYVGDEGITESARSVTLNGAACVQALHYERRNDDDGGYFPASPMIGEWDCPVASLPAGKRLVGEVVANYATGRVDLESASDTQRDDGWVSSGTIASVTATLYTAQYAEASSSTDDYQYTRLNRASVADLEVTVSSAALVGAERLGMQKVTVKNHGGAVAKSVTLTGGVYNNAGKFEPTKLPGVCTGVIKPDTLGCGLGDLQAGQSISVNIPVLAGKKLGNLVSSYYVYSNEVDPNKDNNAAAHAMQIVKANAVPLKGVKVFANKKAQLGITPIGKNGLPVKVKTPSAAKVVVKLQVPRATAESLGLVKKAKKKVVKKPAKKVKGKAAKKKVAPKYVVIGSKTMTTKKAGQTIVRVKFTGKYKKKLLASKKALKVQQVTTVTSNEKLTRGASFAQTKNLTLKKPAKAKKKAKKPAKKGKK